MLRLFSWVVLASFFRQVSFLIVNLILFERLSRSVFGAIALAYGYMSVFAGLGEFGIRQVGWREIARRPDRVRALTGPFLGAKTITVAISIIFYVLLMPLLWEPGAPWSIYLAYGLGIALNGGTFDFPFFGLSRMDLVARYSLIAFGAYLLGCVLLVTNDSRGWLVPSLFVGSMGLLCVLQLRWFHANHGTFRLRLRAAEFGQIVRDSWPIGVGETLNRLAINYPLILIGMVMGSEGVGNYRIAELAYSFLAQFGHLFAAAGFSHLSHIFHHRRLELPAVLKKMLWPAAISSLVAGLALAAFGHLAFEVAFEETTDETMAVLKILGIALIFAAPARFLKGLLASIDRQVVLLLVNAMTVVVGVGVGWVAVSLHGIIGMAIAVLVAEFTTLLVLSGVYWKDL